MERSLYKRKGLVLGLAGLLILTVAVVVFLWVRDHGGAYASPTAVRPWGLAEWNRLTDSPRPVPPINHVLLSSIQPEFREDRIRIEYDAVKHLGRSDVLYTTVDHTVAGEGPPGSEPRLELLFLGVGWIDSLTAKEKEKRFHRRQVSLRFFDPDGTPLTERRVRGDMKYGERHHLRSASPNTCLLNFYFNLHGLDSPKILNAKLFDEITRAVVSGGATWHNFKSAPYSISKRLKLWRSTPLVLSVDVAHGPVESSDMEPSVGQQVVFSNVAIQQIAAVDAGSNGSSCGNRSVQGGVFRQHVEYRLTPPKKGGESLFFFSVSPACMARAIDVEAFDASGKRIERCYSNPSAHVIGTSIGVAVKDVARLRLVYRPRLTRFLAKVNGVPGMPPENENVRNLFDVRVPYAFVKDRSDLEQLIRGAAELQLTWRNFVRESPPAGFFPREYRNATPRDFLRDLELILPGQEVEIDGRDGRMIMTGQRQRGPGRGLIRRMSDTIRGWF